MNEKLFRAIMSSRITTRDFKTAFDQELFVAHLLDLQLDDYPEIMEFLMERHRIYLKNVEAMTMGKLKNYV